jgi:hypothetical protein
MEQLALLSRMQFAVTAFHSSIRDPSAVNSNRKRLAMPPKLW